MNYRNDKHGEPVSILGYGCMRFTQKGGKIDLEKASREIMLAIENGVNYFDTAYIYPGSEVALGQILEENKVRDKVKIATKLPQYLVGNNPKALDKFFDEEKKRLRTDHVDYYLMHHLTDVSAWNKLKAVGAGEWLQRKKESGEIINVGFSYHGDTEGFLEILNDYDWDFCQIQYNYIDETTQAGVAGLKAAAQKGVPVVIMEPLRGGKLAELPEGARDKVNANARGWSPAEWAFRWLWNQPEVTCVLSGMNSEQMVLENCKSASEAQAGEFTEEDFELIESIKEEIRKTTKVNCTGCRYCMPCPQGVDIPGVFRCYNHMYSEGKSRGRTEFIQSIALQDNPGLPSLCIGCGKCERHCPQNIEIIKTLKEADRRLEPWYYKLGIKLGRRFIL
ncbi:MAG: aldo/keto reductase [Clostridiales bacterium]|nr:aldo/keto reductase [Clostridiales bacterium]